MVDISVKGEAGWVCPAQGRLLADVLLPVHVGNEDDEEQLGQSDGEETNRGGPVLLEQVEEGSPCVLTLHGGPDAIGRLLVVSEARTMEVYSQTGEYRGTVRGTRDDGVLTDRADGGPFYKKQLVLQDPSSACEVKLLSLAGRSRVLVCRVVVGLRSPRPRPARGAGIDMQRVQSLVEEMGRSLSPGAQNLMDMVQFQQKNQSGSLGGFLPLLMGGGALSAMARGVDVAAAADSTPPAGSFRPADDGGTSEDSAFSSPDLPLHCTSGENGGPTSPAQLAEMMSHFLKGGGRGQMLGPEMLPVLQSVCGQVTRLRLDDAAAEKEKEEKEKEARNGSWELDAAMERRLEEMEQRLKEHMDRRLDALEQKLEKALLGALPLVALNHGAAGGAAGGAATAGTTEHISPTPVIH
ncbi:ATPase PAAT isoform X2 [Brachyistius frenatus]|uniref:ATPase PAAT isoform X2 n=1 Tax=Brachyistius frenatus TaxID=100188 RepID=UPI0037E79857